MVAQLRTHGSSCASITTVLDGDEGDSDYGSAATVTGGAEVETDTVEGPSETVEEMTPRLKRSQPSFTLPETWRCCMNARACPGTRYKPTLVEHVANTLSHGVGVVTSLAFFFAMLSASHRDLQFYYIVVVYGVCTTLLFLVSSVYHYFEMLYSESKLMPTLRYYLHIGDRTAIYLFIAASYTPWLSLRHCGLLGLNAKVVTWTFAIFGMTYQWMFHERFKRVELAIYILVATSPATAVFTMNDWSGLDMMALGGAVYLVGVVFFKLDGVVPFAHTIWHLHVLAAASIHSYTVLTTLLGPDVNNPMPA